MKENSQTSISYPGMTWSIIFCLGLLFLFTLSLLLISAHYGLDYIDEGYYLNWIAHPSLYKSSVTQFGFIYHPLHVLVQGKIALLRQGNILLTAGLAIIFSAAFFKKFLNPSQRCRQLEMKWDFTAFALSILAASGSLLYFYVFGWLPTPSYNSLTFQGLLVLSIGLMLAEKEYSLASTSGWMIIGLGGWLLFMAKPPSALLATVVLILYFIFSDKLNLRMILLALATSVVLFIVSAWIIDGSIGLYIQRYSIGYTENRLLGAHSELFFRIGTLQVSHKELLLVFFNAYMITVSTVLISSSNKRKMSAGITLVTLYVFIIFGYLLYHINHPLIFRLGATQLWAVPISALMSIVLLLQKDLKTHIPTQVWSLFFTFLSMPYIAAFGTCNNYWMQSQIASFFYVIAGLCLLMPVVLYRKKWMILLPTIVFTQIITLFLLLISLYYPYSQFAPLYQNTYRTNIGLDHSELYLTKGVFDFFQTAGKTLEHIGLTPGSTVLDLTGHSPGIINALQLIPIGQPWIFGSYPGSDLIVADLLKRIPKDLILNAWILAEPESETKISFSVLNNVGIDLNKDYFMASQIEIPIDMGGKRTVSLYAPNKLRSSY